MFDDLACNIDATSSFDPFQPRRGIDFENQRPTLGTDQVHTRYT